MIGVLVGFVFVAIAGFLIWLNLKNMNQAKAAAAWPKCRGKVLDHRIDHSVSRSRKGGRTHTYTPVISYSYEHEGKTYSGSRIDYSNVSHNTQASAERRLNVYPVGSDVDVLVNPAEPGDCTLSATAKVGWFLPVIFLIFGVGAMALFSAVG